MNRFCSICRRMITATESCWRAFDGKRACASCSGYQSSGVEQDPED